MTIEVKEKGTKEFYEEIVSFYHQYGALMKKPTARFGDPFKVTKLNEKSDLIEMFSERSDYTVEEGEPAPAVYENDKLIGELKR